MVAMIGLLLRKVSPLLHNTWSEIVQYLVLLLRKARSIAEQLRPLLRNAKWMVHLARPIVAQCLLNPCTGLSRSLRFTRWIIAQYLVDCCAMLVDHCAIFS